MFQFPIANALLFLGQQWMLVSVLLVLAALFIRHETKRGGEMISIHQLTMLVNRENALLLDVRDAAEYKEGHIVDALHIPFAKLKEKQAELEKYRDRPMIVIDKMGQHSGAAGNQLREAGFKVSRLDGGMTEWRNSNLPVVKD
jgi:rhodanese-related sulfurtransferase